MIALVFGDTADSMPAKFAADRGALYFGQDFDLADLKARLPETLAGVRAQLAWIEENLIDGRTFLFGARPTLPDVHCYYLIWFIRGRYSAGPALLAQFPRLLAWEARVAAIGHGSVQEMSPEQALAVALDSTPAPTIGIDVADPQGFSAEDPVEVTPEGGGPAVAGTLHGLDAQEVVVLRHAPQVGPVAVHFPRVGFRVRRT